MSGRKPKTPLIRDGLSQKLLKLLESRPGARQTAPEWEYSIPNTNVGAVRRRLNALTNAGLIRSEKVGPSRYFWLPENSDEAPKPLLDKTLAE